MASNAVLYNPNTIKDTWNIFEEAESLKRPPHVKTRQSVAPDTNSEITARAPADIDATAPLFRPAQRMNDSV